MRLKQLSLSKIKLRLSVLLVFITICCLVCTIRTVQQHIESLDFVIEDCKVVSKSWGVDAELYTHNDVLVELEDGTRVYLDYCSDSVYREYTEGDYVKCKVYRCGNKVIRVIAEEIFKN